MRSRLSVAYELEGTILDTGGVTAWWIARGDVGGVDVSGLVVASLLAGGRRLLLVDERVAPEQLRGLLDAFQGRLGGPLAELASRVEEEGGCFQVPVSYEEERGRAHLSVARKVSLVVGPRVASGWVRLAEAGFEWEATDAPGRHDHFQYMQ